MLKCVITSYKEVEMLGEVFVKDGVNFIYGESGVGKTVSTIKALNSSGIKPILLDYDNNLSPEVNKCDYVHIDGNRVNKDESTLVEGSVVVIDTYYKMDKELMEKLAQSNTVIIVGHNKNIATKRDIPDAPDEFVNHCDSKLFLAREVSKKEGISYNLYVMKCRGYDGSMVISNWMREE